VLILNSINCLKNIDPSKIENEIILETIDFDLYVEVNLVEVNLRSVEYHPVSCIYSDKLDFDRHNQRKHDILVVFITLL